jgi:hypothetical protein
MASSLQADLNKFSILFPGRKSGVPFSDRLALENFLNTQYPNWDSHNKGGCHGQADYVKK